MQSGWALQGAEVPRCALRTRCRLRPTGGRPDPGRRSLTLRGRSRSPGRGACTLLSWTTGGGLWDAFSRARFRGASGSAMRRSRVVPQIRIAAPTRRCAWCRPRSGSRSRRSARRGAAGRAGRGSLCFSSPTGHFGRFVGVGFGRTTMGRQSAGGRSPAGGQCVPWDPTRCPPGGRHKRRVSIPSARTRGPWSSSPRTAEPCDRGTRACPPGRGAFQGPWEWP